MHALLASGTNYWCALGSRCLAERRLSGSGCNCTPLTPVLVGASWGEANLYVGFVVFVHYGLEWFREDVCVLFRVGYSSCCEFSFFHGVVQVVAGDVYSFSASSGSHACCHLGGGGIINVHGGAAGS